MITLADGVSTCSEAKAGAEITAKAISELLLKKGREFMDYSAGQIASFSLFHILYELNKRAEKNHINIEEYSSTVSSVMFDKKNRKILCYNIGDGIILGIKNETYCIISNPMDSSMGCYVTTTHDVAKVADVKILDADLYEAVIICSDGAWKHMFEKNRLKSEINDMLVKNKYNKLMNFLTEQNCFDDCSFVSLDLWKKERKGA